MKQKYIFKIIGNDLKILTWSAQAILHKKLLSSLLIMDGIGVLYLTREMVFSSTTS